jgi:hypothetical protein
MSSTSSRTVKGRHLHNNSSTSAATPPTMPANSAEPASIRSGFALQDHPDDKRFAAQLRLPPPAKDYSYASVGAIREGYYTEF